MIRKGSFLTGAIIIAVALSGCGESKPASPEPTPTITRVVGCYVATLKQDKFILNIISQDGDVVSANIAFNNFEKALHMERLRELLMEPY